MEQLLYMHAHVCLRGRDEVQPAIVRRWKVDNHAVFGWFEDKAPHDERGVREASATLHECSIRCAKLNRAWEVAQANHCTHAPMGIELIPVGNASPSLDEVQLECATPFAVRQQRDIECCQWMKQR